MAEKGKFSDLVREPDQIPKTAKACVNCMHARPRFESQLMRQVVTCKALPAQCIMYPTAQGPAIRFIWPTLELTDECDLFAPNQEPAAS